MERIFWTQNENPSIPNSIIDGTGTIIKLSGDDIRGQELFDKLLNYQEISKSIFELGNLIIKRNPTGGYFISSNFSERDELDRNMAFMFFTSNTKKQNVIGDLLFFSNLIKRSVTTKDRSNLEKEIGKKKLANKKTKNIVQLIAIAIVVLTIYILWKENS